ncbi:MAG: hypothetical protein IK104_01215 [Clostridia bacterium]|nr:hypothetical protein [Clostridia bacterium]
MKILKTTADGRFAIAGRNEEAKEERFWSCRYFVLDREKGDGILGVDFETDSLKTAEAALNMRVRSAARQTAE